MKIHDLYKGLFEAARKPHQLLAHHMPDTMSFPDMDPYFEYYRFVVAMAGSPEANGPSEISPLRNIPLAVAYSPQEANMIRKVCRKMGIDPELVSHGNSKELPEIHTVSPVPQRGKLE